MNKCIFDYARKAKKVSYGGVRTKGSVEAIVIHNTGNFGDKAKSNVDYFATSNTRSAGAHIFIDRDGLSAYSVPITRIAYAVGNPKGSYKKGSYYCNVNNANSVSIELCDIVDKPVSDAQLKTLITTCKWLKKKCPDIKYVVRHFDVVQKNCPEYYVKNKKTWERLQAVLMSYLKEGE